MNIASIDIGTNTILLLIVSANEKTKDFNILLNKYSAPRIGKNLDDGQPFPMENLNRMFDVLNDYNFEIKKFECEKIIATATQAFRLASDSDKLVKQIKEKYNFDIKIVDGEEEARLSYIGVKNNIDRKMIIDIGGGSTELIAGNSNGIKFKKSFNIGAVKLKEKFIQNNPPTSVEMSSVSNFLDEKFSEIKNLKLDIENAFAVAGTPVTLAFILSNSKDYNEKIIDGYEIHQHSIEKIIDELARLNSEDILKTYGHIMIGREDIILYGSLILLKIMQLLNLDKIICSTRGIRYGAIQDYLDNL